MLEAQQHVNISFNETTETLEEAWQAANQIRGHTSKLYALPKIVEEMVAQGLWSRAEERLSKLVGFGKGRYHTAMVSEFLKQDRLAEARGETCRIRNTFRNRSCTGVDSFVQ